MDGEYCENGGAASAAMNIMKNVFPWKWDRKTFKP